ncbi:MAG: hypothetical protein GTO40_17355, partial [Deltaproteobacteria bacterium]|nr:hypothetical protein [Deltaproteobacteria bacterium]
IVLSGDVPSPISPPQGCRFHPRCPFAIERCRNEEPPLEEVSIAHKAACHRKSDVEKLVRKRFKDQIQ